MVKRTRRGGAVPVCALALGLALMAPSPAAAGPKGSADLQWAQQVLKEKGFDPGKPTGEMTPKTKAALSAYQRSVGLPVTGDTDGATMARLLSGHGAGATMGTLAAPHPSSHAPGAGEATRPMAAPHAAPSARIDAQGAPANAPMFGAGGGGLAPAPHAAPSGTVTAVKAPPPSVPGAVAAGGEDDAPLVIEAAWWVRALVVGVIVAILGGFGALWWWSGRRPSGRSGPAVREGVGHARLEPSFGPAPGAGSADRGLRGERRR